MNHPVGGTYDSVIELVERTCDDPLLVEEFRSKIFKKFIQEYTYARTLTGPNRDRGFEILDHMAERHLKGEAYEAEGYGIIWGILESEAGSAIESEQSE